MANGYTVYEVDLGDACGGSQSELVDDSDATMYVGTKREAEHHAATARQLVRRYVKACTAWELANDGELDPDDADEWLEDEPERPSLGPGPAGSWPHRVGVGDRELDVDVGALDQDSAIRVYRVQLRLAPPRQLALQLLDSRTNGWWRHSRTLVGSWPLLRR